MPMLTEDMARLFGEESWKSLLEHTLPLLQPLTMFELTVGQRHQFVRYDATLDRVVVERPDVFYGFRAEEGPSDSRWMVPGTNDDR